MGQENLKLYSIIRNLSLALNGTPLLCNRYMSLNSDLFLHIFSSPDKDNELLIIHPGTERILASAIVVAAFACIFNGTVNPTEYYKQFIPGEIVIRDGERYRFAGIKDGMCILRSDDTKKALNSITKIPLKCGLNIRPYSGGSDHTGRRGTAYSNLAERYLQRLVGKQYHDQAITMPLCTLIVCSREAVQQIAENLMFVNEKRSYRFADAFPFAWVHSTDDFEVFFGAVGKPEPAFLLTDRISFARELLYEDFDYRRRISTVILYDVDLCTTPESEIRDIREQVNRREKGHLIALQSVDKVSEAINGIIDEKVQTVVWSSNVLLSTIDDLYHKPLSPDDQSIMTAVNRTIDNNIERILVPVSAACLDDLKTCRSLLKQLICFKDRTADVNEFILCAYGLLNLFEQASFTMSEYEHFISEGLVNARSPGQQIKKLYEMAGIFDDANILDKLEPITKMLSKAYSSLYDTNPKEEALLQYVTEARKSGKSFHIIVPKRNYVDIVGKICSCMNGETVSTPARLPHGIDVERLIITATPNVKKGGYNPLARRVANETVLFEYESEGLKNDYYQRMFDRAFFPIKDSARKSSKALFGITLEGEGKGSISKKKYSDAELDETEQLEVELTDIEIEAVLGRELDKSPTGPVPIHAIRLAQFDTGEWAMFSQYYTAYVFDSLTEKLTEKSPVDLCEGANLVFPPAGSEITDFVDEILRQLVSEGNRSLEEHYARSQRWKRVLSDYINVNSLNYQDISDRMRECGYPRHPATISSWLRSDSTIVGPRDVDTFIAIGLAAENEEIADHAELYKRSCDVIRSQRTKILEYIQSSIIHSAERREEGANDTVLSDEEKSYLGDVSKYARKLTIERIIPCERDIPAYLANRPIGRLD